MIFDMKTIFVLIDALKSSYLTEENMPFLYSLSKKSRHIHEVIPGPGFCERSEIFSGLDAFDTGNFTAIGFDRDNSEYKSISVGFFRFLDVFNRKVSRILFNRCIRKKTKMSSYYIPYHLLKDFSLTEDGDIKYVPHNEIADVLTNENKTFSFSCFTSLSGITPSFNSIVELLTKEIKKATYFIPVYIGIIDYYGHRHGQDIASIRPHLIDVDQKLKEIYEMALASNYSICFLGDHGMIPVKKYIDILKPVKRTGLMLNKDYCVFLDSTIARFWFFNDNARNVITNLLIKEFSNDGILIDADNSKDYRIPLDVRSSGGKPLYGDLLWFANKGTLISPYFFNYKNADEKGMHGYLEQSNGDGTGLFISVSPLSKKEQINSRHLTDICEELCSLLEIEHPNKNWKRDING